MDGKGDAMETDPVKKIILDAIMNKCGGLHDGNETPTSPTTIINKRSTSPTKECRNSNYSINITT